MQTSASHSTDTHAECDQLASAAAILARVLRTNDDH
jgi:hypothetical protein